MVSINIAKNNTGAWTYALINMTGQVVSAAPVTLQGTTATINIGKENTPGIYYLQLNRDGEKESVRAISID
jgi:hypothetical protein